MTSRSRLDRAALDCFAFARNDGRKDRIVNASLATLVDDLKREPSRTGSLVVTVFGDAIVPRGGSVWLGTLLEFFALLDVDSGGVRTAMSRLAADGWLERRRVGRNSFYRLADKGRTRFDAAMRHVYDPPPSGPLEMLLLPGARDGAKNALRSAGFGTPLPGVWIAPAGASSTLDQPHAIRLTIEATTADARKLVAASWDFAEMAAAYRVFIARFEPLRRSLAGKRDLPDAQAFVARILLVNAYRRVSLRDPLLPPDMLPPDWPGGTARALCRAIFHALLPASERWLAANGVNEDGPLPPASPDLADRFAG